jgi:adenosyl cobinamide kinase/adenosyl cobinamide phosphate guanylyltransferase
MSHLRAWSGKAVYADAAGRAIIPSESEPMSDDAEIPVATEEVVPRSAAAERMRQHRERRRQGLRCLMIELRETEIDALVAMGLLRTEMRNDASAIIDALYTFLDRTLGSIP